MPRRHPLTPPKLASQWRPAPRTPAWDELWRHILSDVLDHQGVANDSKSGMEPPDHRTGVKEADRDA